MIYKNRLAIGYYGYVKESKKPRKSFCGAGGKVEHKENTGWING